MYEKLSHDLESFDVVLASAMRHATQALAGIDSRTVALGPARVESQPLPEHGAGFAGALDEFARRWAPGFSGSAGPRYLGFVTGGATPAAIGGDWLTSVYDQNPTAGIDSAAPDFERETLDRLRQLFGLSTAHRSAFVSGATMSNFVGLAIGREWLGERAGISVAQEGMAALGEIHVLSGAPHASIYKALSMLGIGRKAVRKIALLEEREAIDIAALETALDQLRGANVIVVANAGTVNTVDFDDLQAIAALKDRYPFWLHVDGAFGAFCALLPEHAHLVAGLDAADSICIDLHKWLNVPYDSAVQFTRRRDLQVRVFQNAAAYLGLPGDNPDFVHLTPENSRRLRAMAAWFSLAAYGRVGHAEIVERNVRMARRLGERLAGHPRFELLAPTRMNVVCFTLADAPTEARVQAYVLAVRDRGETFVSPTCYAGTWGLRAAFSNWRTGEDDVERAFASLVAALD